MKHDLYHMPKGDILIIAGDFTHWKSSIDDYILFKQWLKKLYDSQMYSYQILISGNHDLCLSNIYNHPTQYLKKKHLEQQKQYNNTSIHDNDTDNDNLNNIDGYKIIKEELWNECHTIYLHDTSVQLFGLTFYGTPWHIKRGRLYNASAFGKNLNDFDATMKQIPNNVDVLITHFPPYGIGDFDENNYIGSSTLLNEIKNRIKPVIHIFGHVHQGNGVYCIDGSHTVFANTALKPRVFDIILSNQ